MAGEAYNTLVHKLTQVATLGSVSSVLGWDEQVNLPPEGAGHRAAQLGLLAGVVHGRATDPALGEAIDAAGETTQEGSPEASVVRNARRRFDRSTKLPSRLVTELSETTTLAQQAWVDARGKSDFAAFQPWLEKVISLKREEADALVGDGQARYDALLDEYEPGMTGADVTAIFEPLSGRLSQLVRDVADSGTTVDTTPLAGPYGIPGQRELSRRAAAAIGFDFAAGRIDEAAHPFCSGFGPGDCRLTTRYDETFLSQGLYGTLHEAGHGLYEQGLPREHFGTCLGESASLGVHESQSRMWENAVGRSREFWTFLHPHVTELFETAREFSEEDFFLACGEVTPSLIRVEADEVTYNLHVLLRFELERDLIDGDLAVADLPERWNGRFAELFGIDVPDDARGCLQDVHWAAGLIGYFPTYTLGNLYAAQLWQAAEAALGPLPPQVARGEFAPLLSWLRENVHDHGHRYPAAELIERATGQTLSADPLIDSLKAKCHRVYGV